MTHHPHERHAKVRKVARSRSLPCYLALPPSIISEWGESASLPDEQSPHIAVQFSFPKAEPQPSRITQGAPIAPLRYTACGFRNGTKHLPQN
jgi:hypothetical protein